METNQQEFKQRLNIKMGIATAGWQKLKERIKRKHFQNRSNFQQYRLINNYPKLTLENIKDLKGVRHLLGDLKKKGQQSTKNTTEYLNQWSNGTKKREIIRDQLLRRPKKFLRN